MMKKFKHVFLLILMALAVFKACEKDELLNETKTISTQSYVLPQELKVDIAKKNGLIVFKSREHFDQITKRLISETENYIKAYFSRFDSNATDDFVNEQVEIDKFNHNTVYEAFEKYHSIHSLRRELEKLEDNWMDNSELSFHNPSIYPISERCMAIANIDGEYQIGNTIYRVEKSGLVYEIKDADYEALNYVRNLQTRPQNIKNSNIFIHNIEVLEESGEAKGNCLAYVRVPTKSVYSGKHRMDMILDLDWDGYGSAAKAKTKAYRKKKKLFGGWKWGREWTSMTAQVHLVDFDIDCNQQGTHDSGIKSRNWAYYVSAHVYKTGAGFRTKKGGYFWGRFSTGSVDAEYNEW